MGADVGLRVGTGTGVAAGAGGGEEAGASPNSASRVAVARGVAATGGFDARPGVSSDASGVGWLTADSAGAGVGNGEGAAEAHPDTETAKHKQPHRNKAPLFRNPGTGVRSLERSNNPGLAGT